MNIVFDIGNVLVRWDARAAFAALDAAASFAETAVRRDVNSSICSRTMRQMSRARSGRPEPGSSTTFANLGMYPTPSGATCPNS